jgi:large subunit ribosomal protein L5
LLRGIKIADFVANRYPTKLIPGLHIVIHTTAAQDRDARLLLMGIGIPFHGKLIN